MNRVSNKAIVFENTIISIFDKIATKNKKPKSYQLHKEFNHSYHGYFDGMYHEGIFEDDYPCVVEVKYVNNISMLNRNIIRFVNDVAKLNSDNEEIKYKCLLVTNISNVNKYKLNLLDNIKVFYLEDVRELIKEYPLESQSLRIVNFDDELPYNDIEDFESFIRSNTKELLYQFVNEEKHDDLTLILGAGVSYDYGVPGWSKLVDNLNLILKSSSKELSEEAINRIGGDVFSKAQYIKMRSDKNDYEAELYSQLYSGNKIKPLNSNQNTTLYQICNKFISEYRCGNVITYNYDNYLEQLLDILSFNYNVLTSNKTKTSYSLSIYHVHGLFSGRHNSLGHNAKDKELNSIILSEDDYFNTYYNNNSFTVKTQMNAFDNRLCLFIGNSITDYNEKRLLRLTNKNKRKYAIMANDKLDSKDMFNISAYFLGFLNVNIIWADSANKIGEFIKNNF